MTHVVDVETLKKQIEKLSRQRGMMKVKLDEAAFVRERNHQLVDELLNDKCHLKRCYKTEKNITESLAKEKETCKNMEHQLKEMQQIMREQLKDAERRIEEAKTEASLKAKCNAEVLLQQMQQNTREQLKDAERRIEKTKAEGDAWLKAKNDAEALLAKEKDCYRCLKQQLEQTEQDMCQQLKDAERQIAEAKAEGDACLKARNDAEALLAKEKDWYVFLEQIWQEKEEEMTEELKDAERRTEEAKIEAEACQRAKNDAEALLEQEKQSCMILQQQIYQVEQEAREQVKEAEQRTEEAQIEAESHKEASSCVAASLASAKQSYESLKQQMEKAKREISEQVEMLESELNQSKQLIVNLNGDVSDHRKSLVKGKYINIC